MAQVQSALDRVIFADIVAKEEEEPVDEAVGDEPVADVAPVEEKEPVAEVAEDALLDAFGNPIVIDEPAKPEPEVIAPEPEPAGVGDMLYEDDADYEVREIPEEETQEQKRKKKKERQQRRHLVYDEELGETVVRRRRKGGRDRDEWEETDF
jgi:hypothetical protein